MNTFTTGLIIGDKDVCMFSMTPYSEMTNDHISELEVVMAYLSDKVNQNSENLKEVIDIHARLIKMFGPKVNVELEKPLHIGIRSIVDHIHTVGNQVKPYFRQE